MIFFGKKKEKTGPEHLKTGEWGESLAATYLQSKGYVILGRRVRVGMRDELDLVARHNAQLIFVEVKTRRSEVFGRPLSAVDRRKRHVLSRAAIRYVKRLKDPRVCFRFDVVEVVGQAESDTAPKIRHIENAFPLDRCYALP